MKRVSVHQYYCRTIAVGSTCALDLLDGIKKKYTQLLRCSSVSTLLFPCNLLFLSLHRDYHEPTKQQWPMLWVNVISPLDVCGPWFYSLSSRIRRSPYYSTYYMSVTELPYTVNWRKKSHGIPFSVYSGIIANVVKAQLDCRSRRLHSKQHPVKSRANQVV